MYLTIRCPVRRRQSVAILGPDFLGVTGGLSPINPQRTTKNPFVNAHKNTEIDIRAEHVLNHRTHHS